MNGGEPLRVDSWTVLAMLAGFMFGAGLMSHSDLLSVFEAEFYGFIQVSDCTVVYLGLQLLLFMVAMAAYLLLLVILAVICVQLIGTIEARAARLLIVAVLVLLVSLSATTLFAINKGFSAKNAEIEELKETLKTKGQSPTVTWRWN